MSEDTEQTKDPAQRQEDWSNRECKTYGGISLRMLRALCAAAEERGIHPDYIALESADVAENAVGDLAVSLWRC